MSADGRRCAGATLQSESHAAAGALAARIRDLAPWFHNLHLPGGEQTAPDHPLGDFPAFKWAELAPHVEDDLAGATVLDIGCNAGFYSIELALRGARVFAMDHDPHYLRQASWAATQYALDERVSLHEIDVYDLSRPVAGMPARFDLVLFLGVLYHLRHPLLGLDIVASRVEGRLIFQTLTNQEPAPSAPTPHDLAFFQRERLGEAGWPRMSFIERRFAGDPTNWWAPSTSCCEAMLRSAGMRIVAQPSHETWICVRSGDTPSPPRIG